MTQRRAAHLLLCWEARVPRKPYKKLVVPVASFFFRSQWTQKRFFLPLTNLLRNLAAGFVSSKRQLPRFIAKYLVQQAKHDSIQAIS